MGRNGEGFCGFYSPGGAIFDALGVIGKLVVEELQEAVSLFRRGEDGDLGVERLNSVVPLSSDEASVVGRRRYQAEDGRTIGGGGGGERKCGSVGEDHFGKVNDGDVIRGEVAVDAGVDSLGVIGAQFGDGAGEDSLFGKNERVIGVDGIDKLRANRLSDAQGKMFFDSDGKRCAGREYGFRRLRLCEEGLKEKKQKKSAPCSSKDHLTAWYRDLLKTT